MTKLGYIMAASHSGSTLLAMLLGSHPETFTVGELKLSPQPMGDIDRYRCSCGEFIRACPFWREVKAEMARRGFDFDVGNAGTDHSGVDTPYVTRLLRPLHRKRLLETARDKALGLSPTWRRRYPEIQRRNAALIATIARITRAKVVIDSSKIALRLKYLLRIPELDVKVIRLIRDGRAVALTYVDPASFADARDASLRGGGMGGDRENERLAMAQAAHRWRRCNEEAENILARLGSSQWVDVRYEDLCTGLDSNLSRLFAFFGLDPSRRTRDFRSAGHHVVGNGMRLDSSPEICLDERWRSVLGRDELALFDAVAGETNRRYGYE